jgi:hypothetical protein
MKKTEPVPLPTEPEALSASTETLIEEAVGTQVALQVRRALTRTGIPHNCANCDRRTDSDAATCRYCQRAANEPSVLHQIGSRMGWRTGTPVNLLEILGLADYELLELSQDELAALFDRNVTKRFPSRLKQPSFISGNIIMRKLVPVEWREVKTQQRPPTARETATRIKDEATTARRLREEALVVAQEARISKAKAELASALTVVI